jgi:glycosyltransferase involved in cell wall biosynthesis
MRVVFLSSGSAPARARVIALASRGLAARGHEVEVLDADSTLELRRLLRDVDVCFVHTEAELMTAASAAKLGSGRCAVIRRVAPFCTVTAGTGVRLISRVSATGLLFSTDADRVAADNAGYKLKASVAPLAVDSSEHDAVKPAARPALNVPQDSRLIACVHDGIEQRGVMTMLRTVALLAPRHPDLHVVVIGADRADDMRMHAAALGVTPMVTYLGHRDDELAIIRAASLGWIAAEDDAAALAALDLMASRIPVLAMRTPLTQHYVADGVSGVLLPPADPTTTAATVAEFLSRDDSHVAMGNAGRARLQREFSFETMIRGFEEALRVGRATGAADQAPRPHTLESRSG